MSDLLQGMRMVRLGAQEEVYCIAYGSNLYGERMKARCPGAVPFGTSVIIGYRLLFKQSMTGSYATIEQDANCCVPVGIYRMTAEDEARLDRFEGYPKYYRKQEFFLSIKGLNGRRLRNRRNCIAYIMREHRQLGMPTEEYFRVLEQGYGEWGFDMDPLFKGLEDSIGTTQARKWLKEMYTVEGETE